MAPEGEEWASDTRMHVATSSIDQPTGDVLHTPEDGLGSATSVQVLFNIINANKSYVEQQVPGTILTAAHNGLDT